MPRNTLIYLYEVNLKVIESNLKGITQDDSLLQPQEEGNCINWVLGHIVATRNSIMKLLHESPVWNDTDAAPYIRGSTPFKTDSNAILVDKMLEDLRSSQDKIVLRLNEMSADELETPVEDSTKYEQLAFLQFHETYHAGQLGLLRRLIGKPGAIK